MYRPRIVPVFLLKDDGFYKSIRFGGHTYVGDPLNIVRIFNELCADELVVFDIFASKENRSFSRRHLTQLGEELDIPFAIGGGINTLHEIEFSLKCGADRVVLNTIALENPAFVRSAVKEFGGSTVSVCIDVKRSVFGSYHIFSHLLPRGKGRNILEHLKMIEDIGVGEIIVQSVDRDGTMNGFDHSLMRLIYEHSSSPILPVGGAGSQEDILNLAKNVKFSGYGASSIFVYASAKRGVLANYVDADFKNKLKKIYHENL